MQLAVIVYWNAFAIDQRTRCAAIINVVIGTININNAPMYTTHLWARQN